MHAEPADREDIKSPEETGIRSDATSSIAFTRLEIDGFVRLRSAGRAQELGGLTTFVAQALGQQLLDVGAYAEFGASQQPLCALRTRPSEVIIWATRAPGQASSELGVALVERCKSASRGAALLHVVDDSHGQAAYALEGPAVRELLQRLADASSLPKAPASAVRLRLADLHATLAWRSDETYVVIVDAMFADFLSERVAHAAAFVADPP